MSMTLSERPEAAPSHYLVVMRAQHCMCCGATSEWSELYSETTLKPAFGLGRPVSNLKALVWPKYRIPIRQVSAAKVDRIPFCHRCFQPSLENTPDLLDPPSLVCSEPGRIVGFTQPKAAAATPATKTVKPKPTIATMEDLASLLD